MSTHRETAGTARTPWQKALAWTPGAAAAVAASAQGSVIWMTHPAYKGGPASGPYTPSVTGSRCKVYENCNLCDRQSGVYYSY